MIQDLQIDIVVVPAIVLLLVIVLFRNLSKKTGRERDFKQLVIYIALIAFFLNLVWELAQGTLYKGYEYDFQHIAFCTLASVADAIMAVLLYLGFAFILKEPFWIGELSFTRGLLLMLVGGIGAILGEIRHISAGNWAYADSMPLIPFVHVGLSPVLQFTLLPILIYVLSYRMLKK